MKKAISLLLVSAVMLSMFSCLAYVESDSSEKCVLIDGAALWADIVDGKVYVITAYDDGRTHYAVADLADKGEKIYEMWLPAANTLSIQENQYVDEQFWQDKLHFLLKDDSILKETKVIIQESPEYYFNGARSTNAKGALEAMLKSIYGSPVFDKLIKQDTTSYPGYTIQVKEMLDLDVRLSASYAYTVGMTAGTIIAAIIAKIPPEYASKGLKAIGIALDALGIVNAAQTIFSKSGTLEHYDCTAIRTRYTAVNGNPGPFSRASKVDYLLGLDDKNVSNSTTMEYVDGHFTPDESYYSNSQYRYLIDDAYWSYTHS